MTEVSVMPQMHRSNIDKIVNMFRCACHRWNSIENMGKQREASRFFERQENLVYSDLINTTWFIVQTKIV